MRNIPKNSFRIIYEDNANTLWFGTIGGGLNKLDRSAKKFTYFTHESGNQNSLISQSVRTLYETKDNVLWIGTENGLSKDKTL